MQLRGNWNYPTTVWFGAGRISELAAAVQKAGMKNPLFVTDPFLAKQPMTQKAIEQLAAAGIMAKLYSDVKPNPVEANVKDGVAAFKSGGHDGVVAFGGGSGLDAGKLIAFMHGQTRSVFDFEDIGDWWTRADFIRHRADRRGADHRRHGIGSRPRRGRHQREDPHQEDHLPSADAAEGDDLRSRADGRDAAAHHGRHGLRRLLARGRGALRAVLSRTRRRHRGRRRAAGEGESRPTAFKDGSNIEARAT